MEARLLRAAALAALLLVSMGARLQSANYIVETADPRLGAADRPGGRAIPPRPGHRVAGPGDAQLGPALPDDGPGRAAPGGRRGHHVRLRPRRGVRLADDHSRVGRADLRFGAAARGHAHGVRHPFPPPTAALGRRGRGHQHGVPQREGEAPRHAACSSSARAGASPSTRCSP